MALPRVQSGVRGVHDVLEVVARKPLVVHARDLLPRRGDGYAARDGPHDAARRRAVRRRRRVVDDARGGLRDDALHVPHARREVEGGPGERVRRLGDARRQPRADGGDALEAIARVGVQDVARRAHRVGAGAAEAPRQRGRLGREPPELRPPEGVGVLDVDPRPEHRGCEVGVHRLAHAVLGRARSRAVHREGTPPARGGPCSRHPQPLAWLRDARHPRPARSRATRTSPPPPTNRPGRRGCRSGARARRPCPRTGRRRPDHVTSAGCRRTARRPPAPRGGARRGGRPRHPASAPRPRTSTG